MGRLCTAFAAHAVLAACAFPSPVTGYVVAPGVAEVDLETRARHTDVATVRVLFPADSDGMPLPVRGLPALVLLQGGFVGTDRYRWLAQALVQRGFVVAMPEHLLNLSIFEIENAVAARDLLASPPLGSVIEGLVDPARIAVGGHSLGGVVAGKVASGGKFGALLMMASFPDAPDEPQLRRTALPSLSLAAKGDCQAPLSAVSKGASSLPYPHVLAVMEGATHFQFTESDQPDRDRKCPPTLPLEDAHALMVEASAQFLFAALDEGHTGASQLALLPGVEVSVP